MKRIIPATTALLAALLSVPAQAAAPVPSGATPVDMRGLWFQKGEAGSGKCAAFLGRKPFEPDVGALVISERQFQQWSDSSQTTVYFVTDVQPRRANTWRMQALVDTPPYDRPKVLETYVLELRQDELLWSRRSDDDAVPERVDTVPFVRCGY